jgi:inorganic pyrophosphatase
LNFEEIKHFFEVYKTLEPNKSVHGGDWVNQKAAEDEINNSYKRLKLNCSVKISSAT